MIGAKEWNLLWPSLAETNRLNPAQAYRQRLMLNEIANPTHVLDVGCGSGELLEKIGSRFPDAKLAGLDGSTSALEKTQKKIPGVYSFLADLALPSPQGPLGWASHLTCSEVLEHLDNPQAALSYCRRWLQPGGKLIVTVPAGPMTAFDRYLGHRRHFSSDDLRALLEGAGYERVRVQRAGFPFFNLYRLAVLARGEKIREEALQPSLLGGLAMSLFSILLNFNLPLRLGWQLIATAHRPV